MSERHYSQTIKLGSVASRQWKKDAIGGNTPRALREKGILTENDYSCTISDEVREVALYWSPYGGPQWVYEGSAASVGAFPVLDPVPSPAWIDVLPTILAKWRESEFNLGVTLGEGRESIDLMTSRLGSLASAAKSIRQRNLGGALRHMGSVPKSHKTRAQKHLDTGDVSSAFLELNLGWSPLIRDIYSLAGAYHAIPTNFEIRTSKKLEVKSGACAGGALSPDRCKVDKNERVRYVKVTLTDIPSTYERLGLTNPVGIVWGLTTCSFVADYVLPIGVTIESLHALRVLPVSKCVVTDVFRQKAHVEVYPGEYVAGVIMTNSSRGSLKYTQMNRTVSDGLPSFLDVLREIPLRTKSYMDPSLKKAMTVSALAHSRLKSLDTVSRLNKLNQAKRDARAANRVYTDADFSSVGAEHLR